MVDSLITDAAIALVAERLLTPLQIEQHLILAFEEGFRVGERPVTVEIIENILARDLNDLEARLRACPLEGLLNQDSSYG